MDECKPLPGTASRSMSSGITGFCSASSPPPRFNIPCCAKPLTRRWYSSRRRRASVCFARSIFPEFKARYQSEVVETEMTVVSVIIMGEAIALAWTG